MTEWKESRAEDHQTWVWARVQEEEEGTSVPEVQREENDNAENIYTEFLQSSGKMDKGHELVIQRGRKTRAGKHEREQCSRLAFANANTRDWGFLLIKPIEGNNTS